MKRIFGCTAALAAMTWAVPPSSADDAKADKAVSPAEFVMKAAQGGMYEVKSSEFALQQGASAGVKKFAEKMIADHAKANQELMAAASAKGLTVPPGVAPMQADLLKKLGPLSGAAFDAEYVKQQTLAHEKTVALFKAQAENGQDADLKAWAGKTLPVLEQHLKHVTGLGDKHYHGHGETPAGTKSDK